MFLSNMTISRSPGGPFLNHLVLQSAQELSEGHIRLVQDRRFGIARQMIVLGLGRFNESRVVTVLRALLVDEDVNGHAIDALGKLRAGSAREDIQSFLFNKKPWIRHEAKRALERIDAEIRRPKKAK